jgi:hypothetical protein
VLAEASERQEKEASERQEQEAEVEAEHSMTAIRLCKAARVVVSQSLPYEYRIVLRDYPFDSGPHAAYLQMNDRDMHLPEKV